MKNTALLLVLLAGCSPAKTSVEHEAIDVESDVKSDLWKSSQFLGHMGSPPRGSKAIAYHNRPKYRSLSFNATAGQTVDVWVRSSDGDAVAWLFDYTGKLIRYNDDASDSTLDSHMHVKLPASNGFYFLYFREYSLADATFSFSITTSYGSGLTGKAQRAYDLAVETLDSRAIDKSRLPAAARTTFDKWAKITGAHPPTAYALTADGQPVYVVAQAGEEVYWLDLYASDGTFLIHGADGDGGPGISIWGPAPFWDSTKDL